MGKSSFRVALKKKGILRATEKVMTTMVSSLIAMLLLISQALATSNCVPIPTGLVNWLSADSHTKDLSVHALHGTLIGEGIYQDGVVGPGIYLDGESDSINIINSSLLDFGTGDFTISAWINPKEYNERSIVSRWGQTDGNAWDIRLGWSGGDSDKLYFFFGSAPTSGIKVSETVTLDAWHHILVTRRNGGLYGYLDGVEFDAGVQSASASATLPGTANIPFKGIIDEVQVYGRSLSATEVTTIYQAASAGVCKTAASPSAKLIGWWTGNGTTEDVIGGNIGTLQNGATFARGVSGQGFAFDGADDTVVFSLPQINKSLGTQVTAEFWMYWNGNDASMPLSFGHYSLYFVDGSFGFNTTHGDLWGASSEGLANRWVHIAAIFNNGGAQASQLYINGVLQSATQKVGVTESAYIEEPIHISGWNCTNEYKFAGRIDEVKIYNGALSEGEIQASYHAGSAGTLRCSPPSPGMVARWSGDGNAYDIVGEFNGTLNGGMIYAEGKAGKAFIFDGVDDYIDNGDINLGATFTLDAWVKPANLNGTQTLLSKDDFSAQRSYLLGFDQGGKLFASVMNGSGEFTQYRTSNVVLTTGAWSHIAVTYDGGAGNDQKFLFHVDGVAVPAAHIDAYDQGGIPAVTSVSMKTGVGGDGVTAPFTGLIDEVQIYSRTLSATEISAIYKADQVGVCKPAEVTVTESAAIDTNGGKSYTLTVTNNGPFAAPNVVQNDLIPEGTTLISATTTKGFCNSYGEVISCNIGDMVSGENAVITITHTAITPGVHGDFNTDGKTDILWANTSTNTYSAWIMNGVTKISQAALPAAPGLGWAIVGKGDFNNDGKTDIVWRNQSTGQNLVWLMNGLGLLGTPANLPTISSAWTFGGVGDFNGDNKADIVWRNQTSGAVNVWTMNGVTRVSNGVGPTISSAWIIGGIGDFDKDGVADIVWRNPTTGAMNLWYMNANFTRRSNGIGPTISSAWVISGVADFDKDGIPDVLWRNPATGANNVWYMKSDFTRRSNGIGTVLKGSSWVIVGK